MKQSEEMSKEAVGKRIKELRMAKGMSPFDLCLASRIPEQNVRGWESGRKSPKVYEQLQALARALDTSIDFLVTGVETK